MAKVRLDFGAELDVLTQHELEESLASRDESFLAGVTRGIKWMRKVIPQPVTPATALLPGPAQGFAWDLKMVTGQLTGSDSVAAWIGEGPAGPPIGYAPAPGAAPAQPVFTIGWSSHQQVLLPGDELFIATSGAFRFTTIMITAVQVPAEMLGKILA